MKKRTRLTRTAGAQNETLTRESVDEMFYDDVFYNASRLDQLAMTNGIAWARQ